MPLRLGFLRLVFWRFACPGDLGFVVGCTAQGFEYSVHGGLDTWLGCWSEDGPQIVCCTFFELLCCCDLVVVGAWRYMVQIWSLRADLLSVLCTSLQMTCEFNTRICVRARILKAPAVSTEHSSVSANNGPQSLSCSAYA